MIFCTIAALVVSILYYGRHRNLRIFTFYIAASLVQDIAAFYVFPFPARGSFRIILLADSIIVFILFEFIAGNLFILRYIGSPLRRRIIRVNGLLFFALVIFITILTYPRIKDWYYVIPESVFLVLPCLLYFYELFMTVNLHPLKDQPAFWAVTGILFLNACDIPLLLTANFMGSYFDGAFALNYILYSILFVLLIRAYLCPAEN